MAPLVSERVKAISLKKFFKEKAPASTSSTMKEKVKGIGELFGFKKKQKEDPDSSAKKKAKQQDLDHPELISFIPNKDCNSEIIGDY